MVNIFNAPPRTVASAMKSHVACKNNVNVAGLDGRTTTQQSYQVSLKIRKRVEEIFGWLKTVGGFIRSRYRGRERTQAWGYFVAGTYNLLRLRMEIISGWAMIVWQSSFVFSSIFVGMTGQFGLS
jgi:hypothetical protein